MVTNPNGTIGIPTLSQTVVLAMTLPIETLRKKLVDAFGQITQNLTTR